MRLHAFSDLHLEHRMIAFPLEAWDGSLAELVLLAGDIYSKRRAVDWAADTFDQTTVIIGGNHEVYGESLFAMIASCRARAQKFSRERNNPIHFLERDILLMRASDGTPVRILGATLWTDFGLFGADRRIASLQYAWSGMNDYVYGKLRDPVTMEKRNLTPHDTAMFHALSVDFLARNLKARFDGISIVLTHHAPSVRSIPEYEREDRISPCYASALDGFIEEFGPDLWIHGHIHSPSDYRIGKTRVICNPCGYPNYRRNLYFNPGLVIEV